jgi:hypothetical protein
VREALPPRLAIRRQVDVVPPVGLLLGEAGVDHRDHRHGVVGLEVEQLSGERVARGLLVRVEEAQRGRRCQAA